jgi:chromosome segregation ATPase
VRVAWAGAQAEYEAAGQRQEEARMKITEFNKAIVESNKRLAAQQETMTELEEIWELAKARLALHRLIPTPSC